MTCARVDCAFRQTRQVRIWVEGVAVELHTCLACADRHRGGHFFLDEYERLFRARPAVGVQ